MSNNVLIAGIDQICCKIQEIISISKPLISSSLTRYIENEVKILGGLIGAYSKFFKSLDVNSRKGAENLWTELLIKDAALEAKVECLLNHEEQFDLFLNEIDEKIEEHIIKSKCHLNEGGFLTDQLNVTDTHGKLQSIDDKLNLHQSSVLVITFGGVELAKKWAQETQCKYPIVSDEKRAIYKTFNFGSSVKHTWDIHAQSWYAEQLCKGRTLHPMAHGDDPHQLGGDVVVKCDGRLLLVHRSKFPLDRPTVEELVAVVSQ